MTTQFLSPLDSVHTPQTEPPPQGEPIVPIEGLTTQQHMEGTEFDAFDANIFDSALPADFHATSVGLDFWTEIGQL